MLHIILLILKIIGIILLCIIGIILLALLAILFVPIRYKVDFSIYEYGSANCVVSWFLRAFTINFNYGRDENGKMSFDKCIKIFGIRTGLVFGKSDEDIKEDYPEKDIFEEINDTFSKNDFDYPKPEKTKDDVLELFSEGEKKPLNDKMLEMPDEAAEEAGYQEESYNTGKSIFEKIKDFFTKIFCRLKKIRFKLKSIYGKIKKAYKKAVAIKDFLQMEETKQAIAFLKGQTGVVFNHIKPRKVTGRLKFGTGDPASTGKLLGLIYIFFKGANDKFIIQADFDNKVLDGEIHMKGRLTVFAIALIALKLYRNKNLKDTINRGKKLKEE